MLPYEILVGLRGTMCICARGFTAKYNFSKQFSSQVRNLYNFPNVSIRSISSIELKYKYKDVYINGIKRFHTNLSNNYQASPNDAKSSDANISLVNTNFSDDDEGLANVNEHHTHHYHSSGSVQSKHSRFKKNISDLEQWMFSETPLCPSKEIEKKFPVAKVYLHNIYTIVHNETKILKPVTISMKSVQLRKKIGWACTYNIKWPEEQSFTTIAHSKAAASESAALKCLWWLHLNNKIKNRAPIIYEGQQKFDLLKTPEEFTIDDNILNKMNDFINTYGNQVEKALENNNKEPNETSNMRYQNSHPVSHFAVDRNSRSLELKQRLMYRKQVTSSDLPIFQYKSSILKELDENQALVIKGDTGCGKTTQVPQFIIDYLTARDEGADCSMIVTQPRRISAISLAERIAAERSEQVGDVVGYQVRLQQKLPKQNGGILFCTTGILLKKIQSNPNLEGCSHVIVDEAHERSVDTDMLLVLLRRAMKSNPSLKIIIMSATINADLFQEYLECKSINVPGRMFPVQMYLMDDMFQLNIPFRQSLNIVGDIDEPVVKCDQIVDLIRWINKEKPEGAILCFLPGWGHINRTQQLLEDRGKNNFEVIPLHSKIPYLDQSKVFQSPPRGKRKVILATDIAETGITVPDVIYVIDSACHKEVRWHENKGLSSIDTHWISKANLNQRKGRAGRVQEGESYHFVTKKKFKELDEYPIPEVLRVSLDKTVLDCKTYSEEKVGEFLGSMPQPPRQSSVMKAVQDLQILGALDENEDLTALGKRIALFAIHPKLSKALVYSSIFQCVSPVATIAAALSLESAIFYSSLNNKQRIRETKKRFHPTSDHLAISWIHTQWQSIFKEGQQRAYYFCRHNGLHSERVSLLNKIREINLEHLYEINMISSIEDATNIESTINEYSALDELVRGVLLAGMDQILKHRNFDYRKGRLTKSGTSMVTEDDTKAMLTTECINHKRKDWPSPYLLYYQKTHHEERRTTLIRESSMISPVSVLLFSQGQITGRKFNKDEDCNKVLLTISGKENVQLVCDKHTAEILLQFRDIMWTIVQYYIENDVQKSILNDGDNETTLLFNNFKKKMLNILGNLLVTTSEKIDSVIESSMLLDDDHDCEE